MPNIAEQTLHILLLDDHALFRESVARLLSVEPGFDVVAHCGTIEEALQVLRRKSIDLVLLDFDLGERDGREFLRLAREQGFHGKILLVTAGVDAGAVSELIRSGISGVFRKHDSAALLAQGIRDVMAGKVWLDQEQLQTALTTEGATPQTVGTRCFTERERNVLSFVFEGLANKEIAVADRSLRRLRQIHASAALFEDWSSNAQPIGTYRFGAVPGPDLVAAGERAGTSLRSLPNAFRIKACAKQFGTPGSKVTLAPLTTLDQVPETADPLVPYR